MNIDKFNTTMNALDEALLLEAKKPFHPKKHYYHWAALAAACLALIIAFPIFSGKNMTASELIALGYEILLPEEADNATYQLIKKDHAETAKAAFTFGGDNYIYEVVKAAEPVELRNSVGADTSVLTWSSNGLDLCMIESDKETSLTWYSSADQTHHKLCSSVDKDQLLSTAREVLLLTGLDLASAPENAENIEYHVFPYENLVIAETRFSYNDMECTYRMAASTELGEDIIDISELANTYETVLPGTVEYCLAKLYFNPGEDGKILWYDVVPGIVYSLSLDTDATEETLLQLADELFKPLQGDSE